MSQVNCLTVNDNPPKKMEDEYGIEIRDTGVPAVFDACCKKWAIKALVEMGGHTNILRLQNCAEPELLRYLGIHANLEESYEQTLAILLTPQVQALACGDVRYNIYYDASSHWNYAGKA